VTRWTLAGLLLLPLAELALAIKVGTLIGVWPTLGLLVLAAVAGVAVLRREGAGALSDLRAAQESMLAGRVPGAAGRTVDPTGAQVGAPSRSPSDRLLVILAGVLLMAPGFITDVAGLALLVPPVRAAVRRGFSTSARRRGWVVTGRTTTTAAVTDPDVVDVRVVEVRSIDQAPVTPREDDDSPRR
jgi:UPF0716 protein FxsA